MIYLTGDTHIPIDISKLNTTNFPEQKQMTRDDYVIVLGDFGLLWHEDKDYRHWLKWLREKPFTILWIDGNHENHDWIRSLPVETWHGGKIHRIADNIFHLMRGQIFSIEGHYFFTLGGAASTDKAFRKPHVSWWEGEVPTAKEGMDALETLQRFHATGNTVDYVLTHTCPREIIPQMFPGMNGTNDPTTALLDAVSHEVVDEMTGWYFGHFHESKTHWKFHCLYNKIVSLSESF